MNPKRHGYVHMVVTNAVGVLGVRPKVEGEVIDLEAREEGRMIGLLFGDVAGSRVEGVGAACGCWGVGVGFGEEEERLGCQVRKRWQVLVVGGGSGGRGVCVLEGRKEEQC